MAKYLEDFLDSVIASETFLDSTSLNIWFGY